jgi:hypothetical protein
MREDYALVPAPVWFVSTVVRGLATGMAKSRTRVTGTVWRMVDENELITGESCWVAPAWLGARGGAA